MFPGPYPPGLQDPESGRHVDLDTLLESTGVIDMVNEVAALGLPGPGIQILNGCADLANLFLLGTLTTYITGLAGFSSSPVPGAPVGGTPEALGAPTHSHNPVLAAVPPILCPPRAGPSTGPSPGAPDGRVREAVGVPNYFQNPVLAAIPSILSPNRHVPPPGPALGPVMGGPLMLWEPLLIPRVRSWQ